MPAYRLLLDLCPNLNPSWSRFWINQKVPFSFDKYFINKDFNNQKGPHLIK